MLIADVSTTDELRDTLKRTIRHRVPFARIQVPDCRPDFFLIHLFVFHRRFIKKRFDSQLLPRKRAPGGDQGGVRRFLARAVLGSRAPISLLLTRSTWSFCRSKPWSNGSGHAQNARETTLRFFQSEEWRRCRFHRRLHHRKRRIGEDRCIGELRPEGSTLEFVEIVLRGVKCGFCRRQNENQPAMTRIHGLGP